MRHWLFLFVFFISAQLVAQPLQVSVTSSHQHVAANELTDLPYQEVPPSDIVNLSSDKGYAYLEIDLNAQVVEEHSYLSIAYSLFDTVRFYAVQPDSSVKLIHETGQAFPFQTRLLSSTDFILPLRKGVQRYYLAISSTKPVVVPLRLYDYEEAVSAITINDLVFGAFAGIILVMLLYNLVIFLMTRDRSYIYYIAYLLTLGLAQAALFGYTDRFIFSDWAFMAEKFAVMSGGLVGIASVFFIRNFLHLKEKERLFYHLFTGVAILDTLWIVLLLLGWDAFAYNAVNATALVGSVLAIYVAVKLVRSGYKPANFFLIAWTVFLLGVIVFALKDFNIIPYNPIFRRSMLIGSTIEIILLSVALADRINQLRQEKEASQEEALQMARENERIIREQNIELEKRVEERTMELQEANEELQVTLDNLKDTQTQLVDAEKMASLGQLTAGIAHEINNPINFITSNIKPLRLDLDELHQIIDAFSSLSEDPTNEEVQAAKDKLQELDYDFLKEEVETLVNGISDGAVRTSEIVRGLRTFSRLDEDVIKPANINEGLDSTLVLLKNKTKGIIEVVQDYDTALPDVECYPGKLNQAFMNILNNGIYAVQHKTDYAEGELPTITLRTRLHEDETMSIHLIDNGIGMDEETRRKMFDPFFTTKEVGEGTGLGMSIVFKIIDKHNGNLEVKSEPGKGSEFIITLPLRQPNEFA